MPGATCELDSCLLSVDAVCCTQLTSRHRTSACSTSVPCICAGVEMEALMGAAVAALTVYDMCKAVDKSITIQCIQLDRKTGGKSGDFLRR